MFKVGDRVKFKKTSLESGMIDATEDDVFVVESYHKEHWGDIVKLFGIISTVNVSHLEHVKEEIMEEQEIKWEVGQEVWCLVRGKGVVSDCGSDYRPLIVGVEFPDGTKRWYNAEGKYLASDNNRSLFFSEPVVTAELFPPKKPFVPTLKEGDWILVEGTRGGQIFRREVREETEHSVICKGAGDFEKIGYTFTKLGEEIKFS